MPLLASINFGICLVLSPSHAYNTFLLASIYFGKIILCTKFAKINGKPIYQALQYFRVSTSHRRDIIGSLLSLVFSIPRFCSIDRAAVHKDKQKRESGPLHSDNTFLTIHYYECDSPGVCRVLFSKSLQPVLLTCYAIAVHVCP